MVTYTWDLDVSTSTLQVYESFPVSVTASPASSFKGLESLTTGKPRLVVKGQGWIRLDFGVERPGWLEIASADLGQQASLLWAWIAGGNGLGM